ncbi:MAG: hypothetical protein ABI787_04865 [Spartobacteria bacterium]
MKNLLLTVSLTSLLLSAAHAGETSAGKPVSPIELKRESNFDAADVRDPFWPIGWKRPGPKTTSVAGPDLSSDSFSLSSVTMGSGQHFAILNGKVMQEGQQFGLQFGNQVYQVTLRSIEDGRVILTYQDGEIEVPLRRK